MKSKLQTGMGRVPEMSVTKTWVHSYALPEHFIFDRVMCVSFFSRVLHASSITTPFRVVQLLGAVCEVNKI
jgi:hypothetical protein